MIIMMRLLAAGLRRLAGPIAPPFGHPVIQGVNLGGWLVLEKWITPQLFAGTAAADEYSYTQQVNNGPGPITIEMSQRLKQHRDGYITKSDFKWLAAHGITAVRLPVGYWAFGDQPPYIATIGYVDKAFDWARQTGLKILLDLHGAPGSQNGWDHSGRAGSVGWQTDIDNIALTLQTVERLSQRYAGHPALLGIELLNEPKWTVPKAVLQAYYQEAYTIIRQHCGQGCWVVFSDGFRPRRWQRSLWGDDYANVFIDTHQYQCFAAADKRLNAAGHLRKTATTVTNTLRTMRRYHPVIVGEWSLALDGRSLHGLTPDERQQAVQNYATAQLAAYRQAAAWFYWTYKTDGNDNWSYRSVYQLLKP